MKNVLITGGTARLGAAISQRLRADGWRVITSSHRNDAGADLVADLSDDAGAEKLFKDVVNLLGNLHLDAIVNNAALFVGSERILESVNLHSPIKLTEILAKERRCAAVVNILDTRVINHDPMNFYSDTKMRLMEATRQHAIRFAPYLRVNAVAPGPVMAPVDVHEKAGHMLASRPTADDVASAVAFLLDTPSITGCIIPVDGGQHLL